MLSITAANAHKAVIADTSELPTASADDNGYSFSEDFFSSLFRLWNGEVDRRAAPVEDEEEDEGAERRDDFCAISATRSFLK
ncbi:uncharacterized protein MONOS_10211 [Monocercomonoides exilis]|uniref:uncharacterized protein n=1 Tax=Monocercomonoides exilis TaxID=2049356 RepID=UPI00355A31C7|nr:hypothetical protein MONOS_10211 [Monocercomonoides exilis]|eukprot:MONOS_10211.1-p1 / transcript=MONOS_10211.1 / gene=MONOS_10211 / organism=Monocercomonoides_exilis_PA203 / gene_product=unspecified product / transcript_product=unspecified product / location=Mono_scaffold00454:18122-18367(+) / protein_length=82 / sequence_SO=supercontig / SO=protein_coding / is_pseudo=false